MTTMIATLNAIYADSICTNLGGSSFHTDKIQHIECPADKTDYLVGGIGDLAAMNFMVNVLKKQGLHDLWQLHMTDNWPPTIMEKTDAEVVVVTRGKMYLLDSDFIPLVLNMPVYTMGSGTDFARAALDFGRTPQQAIEYACHHDEFSAGPVQSVEFTNAS